MDVQILLASSKLWNSHKSPHDYHPCLLSAQFQSIIPLKSSFPRSGCKILAAQKQWMCMTEETSQKDLTARLRIMKCNGNDARWEKGRESVRSSNFFLNFSTIFCTFVVLSTIINPFQLQCQPCRTNVSSAPVCLIFNFKQTLLASCHVTTEPELFYYCKSPCKYQVSL